jgi:hypothetical protein
MMELNYGGVTLMDFALLLQCSFLLVLSDFVISCFHTLSLKFQRRTDDVIPSVSESEMKMNGIID